MINGEILVLAAVRTTYVFPFSKRNLNDNDNILKMTELWPNKYK